MTVDAVKRKLCFHCGTPPSAQVCTGLGGGSRRLHPQPVAGCDGLPGPGPAKAPTHPGTGCATPAAPAACPPLCTLQVLQLKDERGRLVAAMDDDSRKLGYYSPRDGWTLHIIDTDPTSLSGEAPGGQPAAKQVQGAGGRTARPGVLVCGLPAARAACSLPCLCTHRTLTLACHWRAGAPCLRAANGWLEDVSKVEKYVMSDEAYAARDNTYRKYKEVGGHRGWVLGGGGGSRPLCSEQGGGWGGTQQGCR